VDLTDRDLLEAAIAKSGLTPTHFAHRIVARDDRMLRRWLNDEREIPVEVPRWLRSYLAGEVTVTWTVTE
jgi:hypothetical protein